MAMTAQVKAELASTQITKTCCRKAEVASMLRFAGGLHIVSGRIVVEAELDTGAAARRLRTDISEVYGHPSDVVMVQGNGIRKGSRYIVRVTKDGEALARQTGLLDQRGRPVRGLPPAVVSGGSMTSHHASSSSVGAGTFSRGSQCELISVEAGPAGASRPPEGSCRRRWRRSLRPDATPA